MVSPMPHRHAAPMKRPTVTPSGISATRALIARKEASAMPIGFPKTSPSTTPARIER